MHTNILKITIFTLPTRHSGLSLSVEHFVIALLVLFTLKNRKLCHLDFKLKLGLHD